MMSPCKIYSGADAYLRSISTKTEGKNQNDLNHRMNNLSIKKLTFTFIWCKLISKSLRNLMGYFLRLVDSWRILFIQRRLQVFGDEKGIRIETIMIVDHFQANLVISRGPFLCQKKSTSNKQMNFKMIGMHFRLKLSKQKI